MVQIKNKLKAAIVCLLSVLFLSAVLAGTGSAAEPVATILIPSDGDTFDYGDSVLLSGSGVDDDVGETLDDFEWWSDKEAVNPILTGNNLALTTLSSGEHTIRLIVTNAVDPFESGNDSISITINNIPPVPIITAPANGSSSTYGDTVNLIGDFIDAEETNHGDTPTLTWTSDIDGTLGNSAPTVALPVSSLSSGTHVITLYVRDNGDPQETATTTINITVNNTAPTATITAPADGSTYDYGTNINFAGTASDPEDIVLAGTNLAWTSSLSGSFGTGSPVSISTLSSGTHVITLTVSDNGDPVLTDTDTITITVNNAPPTANITAPPSNTTSDYGTMVTLNGTGIDVEDGTLSGSSLVWSSSVDGVIGTGQSLPTSTLSSGTHTITLTVTDSDSDTDTDTISLIINNTPPTVTIENPTTGRSYYQGDTIAFAGSGTDPEDGALIGSSLVWRSSLDGQLGTGQNLSLSTLSAGNHTITLTATDSKSLSASTTIALKIGNDSPQAIITTPANNSSFDDGVEILFQGTATDTEEGTLEGSALVWTSNKDGEVGTGNTVTTSNLTSGTHIITLTATDSKGATGRASIQISINNNPPVVTINSPENNSKFNQGVAIFFNGTANDVEDGLITSSSALTWTSNRDGVIGTGTSLTLDDLSSGEHVITLTAVDSQSEKGSASITISAGNVPPTAYITNPAHNSSFNEGEMIYFSGSATDDQDPLITGTALQWISNNNGRIQPIGVGGSFSTSALDPGTHTITLIARDSEGATGTTTITLTIVAKPVLSLSPTSLTLGINENGTIVISGGKMPYRVFSKYVDIAQPTLSDDTTITVSGLTEGFTELTVTDAEKNSTIARVTVSAGATGTGTGSNIPTADAGEDQTVNEGGTVTLDGTASADSGNESLAYAWRQTSGDAVTISNNTQVNPTFVAPSVEVTTLLRFELTVTNAESQRQAADTVEITVVDNGITDFGENVLAFQSHTERNLGIEIEDPSLALTRLDVLSQDSIAETTNKPRNMIYGLIDFEVKAETGGKTAAVIIYLPEAAPAGYKWFKYNSTTGWIDFSREKISHGTGDGAEFNADRTQVKVFLSDDGVYDDDKSDAVIRDPSGLGQLDVAADDDDSGCFLFSLGLP